MIAMEAPESSPPGHKNELQPIFSYNDLEFSGQFTVNNRKYVRFFVDAENPYFIDTFLSEFEDYQRLYFDLYEKANEAGKDCLCDSANPVYQENDMIPIIEVTVEKEGEEMTEKENNIECPVYFVYNLPESLKVGGIHNHKEDGRD